VTARLRAIPEALPPLTPHLVVSDAARAIDHYAAALGARETFRTLAPDGKRIMLCELLVADARLFVLDEFPEQRAFSPTTLGGSPVALHLYVEAVDAAFERAVRAGMTVEIPLADFFWGERYGSLRDPFGHVWGLASRIEDLTPAEIQRRAEAFYRQNQS
jgi:PhnB protein